ncbi:SLAC1 anion channel family protein [Actinoplanes sp. NPDC049599]|uniref:SLAC1 anion channel family protein n=1 Tax=Actinoplanes sp. NPDC049599 TaxID=3363903 RepID=UPI00379BFDDB
MTTGVAPAPTGGTLTRRAGGLAHLPVSVFATVMGLGGTALVWRRAAGTFAISPLPGRILAWTALSAFAVTGTAYAAKAFRHPDAVRREWRHPVMLAFTATIPVSAIILAAALLDASRPLSAILWWAGSLTQLVLTLHVLRVWIGDPRFEPGHVHPAWFIPVVGNLVVPLAGTTHAPVEVSWFFFAVGVGYWLALLPVILNRLFLHGPLPPRLAPTLAILIAPPAVAYLSWLHLGGAVTDPAARILLHLATFQALLLAVQAGRLSRLPFALSAWAYTFPLAALTAALLAAAHAGMSGYRPAAALALGVVSVLTAGLTARTLLAARRGDLSRPEPAAAETRGVDIPHNADLRP